MEEQIFLECIDEMFRLAGYDGVTHKDILDDENWQSKYQMSHDQFREWYSYCERRFREDLNMTESQATQQTALFVINYGIICR